MMRLLNCFCRIKCFSDDAKACFPLSEECPILTVEPWKIGSQAQEELGVTEVPWHALYPEHA